MSVREAVNIQLDTSLVISQTTEPTVTSTIYYYYYYIRLTAFFPGQLG